jgi:nucleoside-diphosphate-sugar epimerase
MRKQDAVLSALGHKKRILKTTTLSEGTKNIIAAMTKLGAKRFVCETSLGIGDSRGKLGMQYTFFLISTLLYTYFKDKECQERCIKESPLDLVIVRPGLLTNRRRRGIYCHGLDIGFWITSVRIFRADVADFMLKQLAENTYLRQTPGLAY